MHDPRDPFGGSQADDSPADDCQAGGAFAGREFPSEAEWLDLPVPEIAPDFVDRTLAARQLDLLAHADAEPDLAGHLLTPSHLAAHAAPEPSPDFVARTVRTVLADRHRRWRETLAKYVAPEPSPTFVSKTLAALATDRGPAPAAPRGRRASDWHWPLLAIAASIAAVLLLRPPSQAPLEQRLAAEARPSLAVGYAASPLPAILAALEHAEDPFGLPSGGADGMHLLLHRRVR